MRATRARDEILDTESAEQGPHFPGFWYQPDPERHTGLLDCPLHGVLRNDKAELTDLPVPSP